VFDLRVPHPDHPARKNAPTGRVRPPSVPGGDAQGLITDYQVLDGHPADTTQVRAWLQRHPPIFHGAPDGYAGDRGFYSAEILEECQKAGVSQVSIPQRGGQKTAERQALESSPAFKKGQRFRVGIEGRISVLFGGRGMKRCRAPGRQRFGVGGRGGAGQ